MLNTGRVLSVIMLLGQVFGGGGGPHGSLHEVSWMDTWLMSYDFGLTIWSIITFFIVLIILKWKAWGPLIDALDKREIDIKNALFAADKAKEDADKASYEYEELVKKAHYEAKQIINEGKAVGEKIKLDIESSANKNAEKMIEKAKDQIDSEKEKVMQEIKSQIVDLSIETAAKIIEKNLDKDDNKLIIDKALEGVGKA